ncbi:MULTISPECIES: hypothetical protein [Sporolactobacillus]|uniref:hypothetical protein n=1 Tax=Sporolactobacillus TaxID=2077 RepID=UPI0012680594|nr:hypothetical protein [Sporolactobacillus terrae]
MKAEDIDQFVNETANNIVNQIFEKAKTISDAYDLSSWDNLKKLMSASIPEYLTEFVGTKVRHSVYKKIGEIKIK